MEGSRFRFADTHGHHRLLGAVVLAWSLSQGCIAQTVGNTAIAVPGSAAAQAVYEVGDIYLPNSRVYVFVGKTGFGHEHGVIGKLKQGRVNLRCASRCRRIRHRHDFIHC